jgi:hypothetical protein
MYTQSNNSRVCQNFKVAMALLISELSVVNYLHAGGVTDVITDSPRVLFHVIAHLGGKSHIRGFPISDSRLGIPHPVSSASFFPRFSQNLNISTNFSNKLPNNKFH